MLIKSGCVSALRSKQELQLPQFKPLIWGLLQSSENAN
jgi:hypothetical protein